MPIKGLTDANAAFPRIGVLRKGSPKKGNTSGRDLDHFRFDTEDMEARQRFEAEFGSEPREVSVLLPHDTVDENLFAFNEEWAASGLLRRCDGEFIVAERVGNNLQRAFLQPKPCLEECGCKPVGRMAVIIPALQRFAYVTVSTTSKNDLANLSSQLHAIALTFGRLKGIPMVLARRKTKISTPTKDGRASRDSWLLSIEVDPEWSAKQLSAAREVQMLQASQYLLDGSSPNPYQLSDRDLVALPESPKPEAETLNYSFLSSETWENFVAAMHNAIRHKTPVERINQLCEAALNRVDEGVLPPHAKTSIFREREKAIARHIENSAMYGGVAPIDAAVTEVS